MIARSEPVTRADLSTTEFLPASAVVLATGGTGRLFSVTTNAADARGEGIGMAARAGAVIADAEFVQFHPTAIDVGKDPAPLATEALRGEGAVLVNRDGTRFMSQVHELAELAPRDIVARAVFTEARSERGAFLDCRGELGAHMSDEFPTVFSFCQDAGLNPETDLIPVAPAAHYHMGGILTDANGRTTVEGLWACGEVTSTGAHGANRLASNSLLEAVVFGGRIAEEISNMSPRGMALQAPPRLTAPDDTRKLRQMMNASVGVERDGEGLAKASELIATLTAKAKKAGTISNMLLAAQFIVQTAIAREESRGGHYRKDFKDEVPELARRSYARLVDGDVKISSPNESEDEDEGAAHG
ncbi:UNVERIFIED_CONTAM: hypothetical protein GTU68_051054 [Idotea baltica]|nr:hypothetical protein [Idotea baltica]